MRRRRLFISFVLLLFSLSTVSPFVHSQEPRTDTTKVAPDQEKLSQLSLEQKVGQLFIFGFSGSDYDSSLKHVMRAYNPGGIITFKRNIKNAFQIAKLNQSAQKQAIESTGLPLLIMVDQEGGSVTRIKTKPSAPSALALGMTDDMRVVEQTGRVMGHMLNILGFNMNLAPVLDLSNPTKKNFIGNRSFGNDPHDVSNFALAFSLGSAKAGVLPTAKHFPGHGGIVHDSHREMPKKLKTLEELQSHELVPFKSLIDQFPYPKAIMAAHVAFPNIDASGVPATFSKVIMTDLLRKTLKFDGLVITDDIEMAGAGAVGSVSDRAVQAIQAGCDMIMVAWRRSKQKEAYKAVLKAVKEGKITEARIDESLRRILLMKQKLAKHVKMGPIQKADVARKMKYYVSELKTIAKRVGKANFKKSADQFSYLNGIIHPGRKVHVFSADPKFFTLLKESVGNPLKYTYLSRNKSSPAGQEFVVQGSLGIYYVTGLGSARMLKRLSAKVKKQLIVVNTTHPGVIPQTDQYMAMIQLHSRNFESARWVAEFFFKDSKVRELQIRLPSSEEQARRREIRRRLRQLYYYN